MMHAGVGKALGGVCTIVGEPQNLVIGQQAVWEFLEFAIGVSPVTIPVFFAGIITCVLLEKVKWFGYGVALLENVYNVYNVLNDYDVAESKKRSKLDNAKLIIQGAMPFG
jgi:NhaB family Na+:H+ antiporter